MTKRRTTPASVADEIRRVLKAGGSAERSSSVQRFFKEEVDSHGWRTADLRRATRLWRREILQQSDLKFLLRVADHLFAGGINEEKGVAVFLLENITDKFGDEEFRLLESWLPRISNWSDHDGLVHYLIAPMMVAKPARASRVFRWAKSQNRWFRRAACVALIQGTRRKMFFSEVVRVSGMLLLDEDDMVQKGLGWLLRETAKFDAPRTVPYLLSIRQDAPRLVLRTACETLPRATRKTILKVA
ncbi:MAG: DNA alkylation repair protein [Terriglobales bacterium]